jgi:hypothetical protein
MDISVIISLIAIAGTGVAAWIKQNIEIAVVKNEAENLKAQFNEHKAKSENSIDSLRKDMNEKFGELNTTLTNLGNALHQLIGKIEVLEKQHENNR